MIGQAQPLADNWQITVQLFAQPVANLSKFWRDSFVAYMIEYIPVYFYYL
jgi:hypothetical protein